MRIALFRVAKTAAARQLETNGIACGHGLAALWFDWPGGAQRHRARSARTPAVSPARRVVQAFEIAQQRNWDRTRTAELDYLRWGISQARRAWVEPANVLNTRSRADLLAWVAGKPARATAPPTAV